MKKTASCPYPRPVAFPAACTAAKHDQRGWSAQREHECAVHVVTALEQVDASGDDRGLPRRWHSAATLWRGVSCQTLLDLLAVEPQLIDERPGQTLIGDKNYFGRGFEQQLAGLGIQMLRPTRKGEAERAGSQLVQAAAAGHRVGQ
jgi:hypothetical protein